MNALLFAAIVLSQVPVIVTGARTFVKVYR